MNVVSKIKTVKEKVVSYLFSDKRYKENDNMLVARWWNDEVIRSGYDPKEITAYQFFTIYAKGEITQASIIERSRRLAQVEFPELRGDKWEERHREEKNVREEINN